MRNLAVAEGLVQDELCAVERAWFVLCAHEGNPEIMSQWEAWRAATRVGHGGAVVQAAQSLHSSGRPRTLAG